MFLYLRTCEKIICYLGQLLAGKIQFWQKVGTLIYIPEIMIPKQFVLGYIFI